MESSVENPNKLDDVLLNEPVDMRVIKRNLLAYVQPEGRAPGMETTAHYLGEILPDSANAIQFFGLADFSARSVGENFNQSTGKPFRGEDIDRREVYSFLIRQALRAQVSDITKSVCPQDFADRVMAVYSMVWKPS